MAQPNSPQNEPTDDDLDTLLARGRLGGRGRERTLANVLDATAKRSSPWFSSAWFRGLGLASVAAGAMALFFLRPRPVDSFTARGATGGSETAPPRMVVECIDGSPASCKLGSTLVFRFENAAAGGYAAAYADREGSPAGAGRVWYFPASDDTDLPPIRPGATPQVLSRGVRLGPEHTPGRYVMHIVLAKRPLPRAALLDTSNPDVVARSSTPMEVTP